jgi:hypothetical protein
MHNCTQFEFDTEQNHHVHFFLYLEVFTVVKFKMSIFFILNTAYRKPLRTMFFSSLSGTTLVLYFLGMTRVLSLLPGYP